MDIPGFLNKIVDWSALERRLDVRRAEGECIVFTNGCFDLLHTGHVHYLAQARALGDLLVLGLNSDDSVRALKGPKRPIRSQTQRAVVLAALECVDLITFFDQDTPAELIELVRPDVLVKGGDWSVDRIVGADFVLCRGGRVESLPLVDGESTTAIISRIVELETGGR